MKASEISLTVWTREDRETLVREIVEAVTKKLQEPSQQASLVDGDKLAEILGVSRPTVDRLVRDGKIPSVLAGRRRLYSPVAVIAALSRNGNEEGATNA